MKLECSKEKLRQVVGLAERLTGKNLSLPVLGQVFLSTRNHSLIIRSTNLDLGGEWSIPAKIIESGEILIPGTVFYNLLSGLTGVDKITLNLVNNNLAITVAGNSTLLKVLSAADFPTLPEMEKPSELTVNSSEFVTGIKSVAYAAALNDIKPEIASVYIYNDKKSLYFVSTDSFRLAEKKKELFSGGDDSVRLIIPVRNITELVRVLEQVEGELRVQYNNHQVNILAEQLILTSRLVDGVFPDYRQIMPNHSVTKVSLNKLALVNALKLSQIFTDRLNHITLKIRPEERALELMSQNGDVGETINFLTSEITGEELTINLNLRYLLDGLQSVTEESVLLEFNGKTKPIMLTGVTNDAFRYLIMPLNR